MIMHKWETKNRQKAHDQMIGQAKPTIKRYSKSRQKQLSNSRSKISSNPHNSTYHNFHTVNSNIHFKEVLKIFQLSKYEELLLQYGFPQKIKDKQSAVYIDEIVGKVEEKDQDQFLSLMSALLSLSSELKNSEKRTPKIKKKLIPHFPPQPHDYLKKSSSITFKKSERTPKFRIKNKLHVNLSPNSQKSQTKISAYKQKIRNPQRTVKKKSKDDFAIIHQYRSGTEQLRPVYISESNKIIKKIAEKLKKLNQKEDQQSTSISKSNNLYYEKVKELYLSYDNATMTSNIANIDMMEIIECFSIEIETLIENQKEDYSCMQDQTVKELLKRSLLDPNAQRSRVEKEESEVQQTISNGSLSSGSFKDSSDGDQLFFCETQSFTIDFTCFNYRYEREIGRPTIKDIKDFVQLVMMAGKMEKEAPIIGFSYIRKMLKIVQKQRITPKTWKNIVLIALIEASKIWDDQSLQNNSFSKVISPYTTMEINRLERHLLYFLNYKLKIQPKEYCQNYFKLRNNIERASKTANLMRLNLETITKLQSGVSKCQKKLKKTYKKKMNDSF